MSGARERVLGGIRRSLGRGPRGEAERQALEARILEHRRNLIPARAQLPRSEQVQLFADMAVSLDATVTRVASLEDVPGAIADYLAQHNLPMAFRRSPDPALDAIPWQNRPLLTIKTGRAEADDLVSVTPAFAGIAETGTLMFASGSTRPATLNFLPDNHVVVIKSSEIVGDYETAFTRLREQAGGGVDFMPRTVNLVTGPSRTADIEQTLILGAHGPRRLHIVIVNDEAA